jgi:hypothetical protein
MSQSTANGLELMSIFITATNQHYEGVIELFRAEVFPEFLSQRVQFEGSNYPGNPSPEKLNRLSGELCF